MARALAPPPDRALAPALSVTLGWLGLALWFAATLACATAWAPRSDPPSAHRAADRVATR